jgi:hypothetical protein
LDNFDDRYLGAKTSDPALDNDGNALVLGALYFNSTDGVMKVYTASGWIAASSASVATLATFEFVATSGQTVFSGNDANGVSLSYVAPAIIVTLNGVRLRPGDDYTATNGTSLTLVSAAALNDELVVDAFGSFLVANTYTIAQADALLANKVSQTSSTGAATMPVGTTGQRPGTPATGMFRMNSTTGNPEWYDATNSVWVVFGETVNYSVEYLVVAGGGSGGSITTGNYCAGGGGAGGYLATTGSVSPLASYTITVGAGGSAPGPGSGFGNDGSNSVISGTGISATSIGGGGGARGEPNVSTPINGRSGGSGGGGCNDGAGASGTSGQGTTGGNGSSAGAGYGGGGGGGAGAVGSAGSSAGGGAGGAGLNWQSLGTFYAGGGGGGGYSGGQGGVAGNGGGGAGGGGTTGSNGTANRGGGGGGTGSSVSNFSGGGGGSGVVIIRYLGSQKGTGGTVTSSGGYTYHTFTSSGTFTA